MKIIKRILLVLLVIFVIGAGVLYYYLNQKKAVRDGELSFKGLSESVEVNFDKWGVAHIQAKNEEDLHRAFGYIHAQDRLFQMELMTRLSQGQLAEVLGPKLLEVDQLFRTLQLHQHAKKWISALETKLSDNQLRNFEAYLDGVNQYVKTRPAPIEFDILGIPKREFTNEDVASIMGYISYSFVMAFREDPLVHEIATKLGPEYVKDLGTHWLEGSNTIPVQVESHITAALANKVRHISDNLIPAGLLHGSNSWVIGPEKTKSGKALFVNDPHIGYAQPSVWYEAHLKSPGYEIYGHFMALLPVAVLGFNEDIAWGLTMFENDDVDFYREKLNPDNPNQYWAINHWKNFETRDEIIKVKGQEDVVLKLRKSRHGPIITDAFARFKNNPLQEYKTPLAMWWAFHDTKNGMVQAFDGLIRSKTVKQARDAISKLYAPGLNFTYANKNGDIAWWAAGKLPIRPKHVNSKMILDGASGKDDILGFYNFSKNPQNVNPKKMVLYTSNNQPADTGIGLIPGYYAPRDRAQRIEDYIFTDKTDWSMEDMEKMLLDNTSPLVKLFQKAVIPVLSSHPETLKSETSKRAFEIFQKWQGNHDTSKSAVTLFYRFKKELIKQILLDELGENSFETMQSGFLLDRTLWKLIPNQQSVWWDNIKTKEKRETASDIIISAWSATIDYLRKTSGDDTDKWQWKDHALLEHQHALGTVKPLNLFFNVGPFAVPAGQEIINNLSISLKKDPFRVRFGPSTRRIIDFGAVNESVGILPTGQSGYFFDKHYDDQAEMFVKGQYRQQYLKRSDIIANSEGQLLFHPLK